jgi:hypothetical protein
MRVAFRILVAHLDINARPVQQVEDSEPMSTVF